MTAPQLTPRPHGWLWEIMSVLGQLVVGIIIRDMIRDRQGSRTNQV